MDALLLDLKYGFRSLRRDKGFALTVLLTFSVCIAANAALFAIVNSVILRPLPVSDANSILIMSNEYPKAGVTVSNDSSSGDYFDRLREMTAFESQAVFRSRNQTVELNGSPQQIPVMTIPIGRAAQDHIPRFARIHTANHDICLVAPALF
jgi:hypothetical protein